jgi:Lon protease-like protein
MNAVRLFPLPNLVFFPQVMQPLHIFEPRYRQMTEDALADDRLIAMVLPMPGWEEDYAERPAIHAVACVGRIMAEQRLEDGRFNILLRGTTRVHIVEELPASKLYRLAKVKALNEIPLKDEAHICHWRQTLNDKMPAWFVKQSEVVDQLRKLLDSELDLGTFCDIMTFALPLDAEFKQQLLEELDAEARLRKLHDFLEATQAVNENSTRKFPPEFSVN